MAQFSPSTSLYELSLNDFVSHIIDSKNFHLSSKCVGYFSTLLAPEIYLDFVFKLSYHGQLDLIANEIADADVFYKIIKISSGRNLQIHRWFQGLMDFCMWKNDVTIAQQIAYSFVKKCKEEYNISDSEEFAHKSTTIASFLSEAGWLTEASILLKECLRILNVSKEPLNLSLALFCSTRLLSANNGYCQFDQADDTVAHAWIIIEELRQQNLNPKLASFYAEISNLHLLRSNYSQAFEWSFKALCELNSSYPLPIVVKVLRQSATACVLKRKFKKAELLIKQALLFAKKIYPSDHLKYADTLSDFAFYLLNVDSIRRGIKFYRESLKIREKLFGANNLYLAIGHEDMAYASYVYNYSRGQFGEARDHAEESLSIMKHILPQDHLLLASCKRVKALIIEEIAIDHMDAPIKHSYFEEALMLHNQALKITLKAFGECNVQTAKHYGNLGRLYQTMSFEKKSEEMHKRAIDIKEKLLGPDDHEVALSVGHLASLYNYDMNYYDAAEQLYYRSIEIGINLFGEAYSGLQYDYRGLLRIFDQKNNVEEKRKYLHKFDEWRILREELKADDQSACDDSLKALSIEEIQTRFSHL